MNSLKKCGCCNKYAAKVYENKYAICYYCNGKFQKKNNTDIA